MKKFFLLLALAQLLAIAVPGTATAGDDPRQTTNEDPNPESSRIDCSRFNQFQQPEDGPGSPGWPTYDPERYDATPEHKRPEDAYSHDDFRRADAGRPLPHAASTSAYLKNPCRNKQGQVIPIPHEVPGDPNFNGYHWFGLRPSGTADGIRVKLGIPRVTMHSNPPSTWAFQFVAQSVWFDEQEYGIVYRSDENRYRVYSYRVKDCSTCSDSFWTDYGITFQPGDTAWLRLTRCGTNNAEICGAYSRDGITWYNIDRGIRKNVNNVDHYGEVVTNKCHEGGNHPTIGNPDRYMHTVEQATKLNGAWQTPPPGIYVDADASNHYQSYRLDTDTWYAKGGGSPISC